jgi:hypothetical protein
MSNKRTPILLLHKVSLAMMGSTTVLIFSGGAGTRPSRIDRAPSRPGTGLKTLTGKGKGNSCANGLLAGRRPQAPKIYNVLSVLAGREFLSAAHQCRVGTENEQNPAVEWREDPSGAGRIPDLFQSTFHNQRSAISKVGLICRRFGFRWRSISSA